MFWRLEKNLIHLHRFASPQVLCVAEAAEGKLGVPFLNWHVSGRKSPDRSAPRDHFAGGGLYGVCFRGRLVYVGSFSGERPHSMNDGVERGAYCTGDIVSSRWWAHIGSLTARGHRLNVSRRKLANLRRSLGEHPMILALGQAGQAIHTDQGCLGAENRLRFAAKHWPRFSRTPAPELLRQFSFVYAREDGSLTTCTPAQLRKAINDAEKYAIAAMQPEANGAAKGRIALNRSLSPKTALAELAGILDRQLEPYRPHSAEA